MKRRKIPRATHIHLDLGEHKVLAGLRLEAGAILKFVGPNGEDLTPRSIMVGASYARDRKSPKVIQLEAVEPTRIEIDTNNLLRRFDFVFAVDTNTKVIGGQHVSVTASFLLSNVEVTPGKWSARLTPQSGFEFHESREKPERVGWVDMLKLIAASRVAGTKVALIVDSDLDALQDMNEERQPILGEYYVPKGVTLIYASGERGSQEFAANRAMAECDRMASYFMKEIESQRYGREYFERPGEPYVRYRYLKAPDVRGRAA